MKTTNTKEQYTDTHGKAKLVLGVLFIALFIISHV